MVENQEQDDQDSLVEELALALHQESAGNFASTVKTIVLGGDLSRTERALHSARCSHRVFSALIANEYVS